MDQPYFYLPEHHLGPLVGLGIEHEFICKKSEQIVGLQTFLDAHQGKYVFGTISYELKNCFEKLNSQNLENLAFPLAHFWTPKALFRIGNGAELISGSAAQSYFSDVLQIMDKINNPGTGLHVEFKERTSKKRYFERFNDVKNALQRGDIYELNYCQEFYAENITIDDPIGLFAKLHQLTNAPHAAFFQTAAHNVFCASPERYLEKKGETLRSEPIKGTAARSANSVDDQLLAEMLKNDPKERAENIMIVDLVRNDLSQVAQKGSVKVEELCEIYSFATVHQMISKISCQLKPSVNFTEILKYSFPMGSMTGAPKISAMQHIEQIEDFQRGLYAGSIGLIEPNGDFDFNVVIRSLLYNRNKQYLSCAVGSAITIDAEPEKEYQECLLKANKLIHGLQS